MNTGRLLLSVLLLVLYGFLVACGAPPPPTAVPSPVPTIDSLATETSIAAKIFATQSTKMRSLTLRCLLDGQGQDSLIQKMKGAANVIADRKV